MTDSKVSPDAKLQATVDSPAIATETDTIPSTTEAARGAQNQTDSRVSPAERAAAGPTEESLSVPPSEILPATHWAQLPLDAEAAEDGAGNGGDEDSAFGDVASSTASLSESILEYRHILGRTFHSNVGVAESWYAFSNGVRCVASN